MVRSSTDEGRIVTIAFPGDSADYRAARDRRLEQEIELRRATEAVAVSRRALPPGGPIPEDYVFQGAGMDGSPGPVTGETALLPLQEGPCPSCTALLDQVDGAVEHAEQHINFAVVAKTSLPRLLTFAEERGWRRLRLLSSAANTYHRDYHGETAEGFQRPMLNVFHRDGDTIRHFWASELLYAPTDTDQEPRHVGTLEPLWNLFDLTLEGRPSDSSEQLSY